MEKLLSVIMPTYNRAWIIENSLNLIKEQIIRNSNDVELIVCNNASTDNTVEVINNYIRNNVEFFKFVNYTTHVDIGISISRSIDNASGKYFLLWGDDDVPDPRMIDTYVDALKRYKDLGCIYSNRLQGVASDGQPLHNVSVFDKWFDNQEVLFDNSETFIKTCYYGMTFLSVDLLSVDAWKRGKFLYNKDHFGFEYLAPFLYGISGAKCLYIRYPMCIQRLLEKPRYIEKWVLYFYVGLPRVLKQMEDLGVITNWQDMYKDYQYTKSDDAFINHFVSICLPNRNIYLPYVDEIVDYQKSRERKLIARSLRLPKFLFLLACKIIPLPRKTRAFLSSIKILRGIVKLVKGFVLRLVRPRK